MTTSSADVQATLDYLRGNPNVDADNIGIVGFCFGGMVSYLGSTMDGIKAAAVYYGGGILPRPGRADQTHPACSTPPPTRCRPPSSASGARRTQASPSSNVEEIERVLKEKGKSIENHVYDGAGHGFFCSERGSYHEAASADSWPKTLAFFGEHLK